MDRKIIRRIQALMKKYDTNQADVFDLDGTVIDGNLLTSTVHGIVDQNLAQPKQLSLDSLMMNILLNEFANDPRDPYRNKNKKPYNVIEYVENGLFEGLSENIVEEIIHTHTEDIINSCFSFPRTLILALRQSTPRRLIICITGTPQEIADIICPVIGFDVAMGCIYPKKNGQFIPGEKNLDAGMHKGLIMDQISETCGINWNDCIAAGNSKFDLEMFNRTTYPLAINPDETLQEIIRAEKNQRWKHGRIAWIDQEHGKPITDMLCWIPDTQGKLCELPIKLALPYGTQEQLIAITNKRMQRWFSQ